MSSLESRQREGEATDGYLFAEHGCRKLFLALAHYHKRRSRTLEERDYWHTVVGNKSLIHRRAPRKVTRLADTQYKAMLEALAERSGYSVAELVTHDQSRKKGYWRKAFCLAMANRYPDLSLTMIAEGLGRRDHSTAWHAITTGTELFKTDADFAALVLHLEGIANGA